MREAAERPAPETDEERRRRLNRERQERYKKNKTDGQSGASPLPSSEKSGAASLPLPSTPPAAPPPWKRIFGGGAKMSRALSEEEANELREPLTDALVGITDFFDKTIQATTKGHDIVEIWSTMDDAQIEKVVTDRLKHARRSAVAAQVVRRTIEYYEELAIYAIVLPRVVQTVQVYRERGIGIH